MDYIPKYSLKYPDFCDPLPNYKCVKCNRIPTIFFSSPCGHRFCYDCKIAILNIYKDSEVRTTCPARDQDCVLLGVYHDFTEDFFAKKHIGKASVHCLNKNEGCQEIMKCKHLENHISSLCPLRDVPSSMGCNENVSFHGSTQNDLSCHNQTHLKNEREYEALLFKSLSNVNETCDNLMKEFSDIKSSVTELQNERANAVESLNVLEQRQGEKSSELEKGIQHLSLRLLAVEKFLQKGYFSETSYDGVLLWKIENYKERFNEAHVDKVVSLYSPPFYTSRHGYKLCARVYLNGDGVGLGSHLSIFIVLMRSEYDALLQWPFKQQVTFHLLSQDSATPDYKKTFSPDDSRSFARPLSETNTPSGFPAFVRQYVVQRPMYLSEDTIFLKISVDRSKVNT